MRYLLLMAVLCAAIGIGYAQTPDDALKAKDYAKYLTQLPQVLVYGSSYERAINIAIALEKTNGWGTPTEQTARDLAMKLSPKAGAWLDGAHLLVQGESRGLLAFRDNDSLEAAAEFVRMADALRAHGFTVGADACQVIGGTIAKMEGMGPKVYVDPAYSVPGLDAWSRLPIAQLDAVAETMAWRDAVWGHSAYLIGAENRNAQGEAAKRAGAVRALAEVATIQQKRPLDYVRCWPMDKQAVLSGQAVLMAQFIAERHPANAWMQLQVVDALWKRGEYAKAVAVLHTALTLVPEPDVRDLRMAAWSYLNRVEKDALVMAGTEELAAAVNTGGPTAMADAALAAGDLAAAARQYAAVRTADAPLSLRASAWAGLLDADPSAALAGGQTLLEEIGKLDPALRTPMLRWFGWQLWRVAARDVPVRVWRPGDVRADASEGAVKKCPPPTRMAAADYPCRRLAGVPTAYTQLATLMRRTLTLDPRACLTPDLTREWVDLRFGASMVYLLAGRPDDAGKVVWQPVEETIPAPWYGWREMSSVDRKMNPLRNGADKRPKRIVYPRPSEDTVPLVTEVALAAQECPAVAQWYPAFAAAVMPALCPAIATTSDPRTVGGSFATPFGLLVNGAITVTEHDIPVTGKCDMTRFEPIAAAVESVIADPRIYACVSTVTEQLIIRPTTAASSDDVRERMLKLICLRIEQLADAGKRARQANMYAEALELGGGAAFKPYAQRIREKYPKP